MRNLVFALLVSACGFAKPTGHKCVAGQVTQLQEIKDGLKVHTRGNTIIEWNEFSINPRNTVIFDQASAKSAVLNRVTGDQKSHIIGNIESNGKVYLLNKNGIVFGPRAHVKTAGFIASTGNIQDAQFLNSDELHISDMGVGTVLNQGTIESDHGSVMLISKRVTNTGTLKAPEGTAGMASGYEVVIKPDGPERIFIQPHGARPAGGKLTSIENFGDVKALVCELKSHRNPYACAISISTGTIEATKIANQGGRILLVSPEGRISINGDLKADSGTIAIKAKETRFMYGSTTANRGNIRCESEVIDLPSHHSISADNGKVNLFASKHLSIKGDISAEDGLIKLRSVEDPFSIEGSLSVGEFGNVDLGDE